MRKVFVAALICAAAITSAHGRDRDPRPAKWCGWWLRQELSVADRRFNRAAEWRHYGSAADGPAVRVIVVWRHHVGIITGRTESGWLVKSGNDGGRVRERSLRGVIAFRRADHFSGTVARNDP